MHPLTAAELGGRFDLTQELRATNATHDLGYSLCFNDISVKREGG